MALYSTSRKGARARARGTGTLLPAGLTRTKSTGGRADGEAGEPSRADPDCRLESRPFMWKHCLALRHRRRSAGL